MRADIPPSSPHLVNLLLWEGSPRGYGRPRLLAGLIRRWCRSGRWLAA